MARNVIGMLTCWHPEAEPVQGVMERLFAISLAAPLVLQLLLACAITAFVSASAEGPIQIAAATGTIPPYTRPEHTFMIPLRERNSGITYMGSHERLRVAMDKAKRGEPLLVAVAGGSNTVGSGAIHGFPWPRYLYNWLSDTLPNSSVVVHNGALPATTSGYMAVCHSVHIPRNASIVILEYSINDPANAAPPFDNDARRAFERLVRKVLDYPTRPAVLLLHAYVWGDAQGRYWENAERDLAEFAHYYGLPSVSVKACCYHLMRQGVPGFRVDQLKRDVDLEGLRGQTWYSDGLHGAGDTGCRGMGELTIHLLMRALAGLEAAPLGPDEAALAAEPLPPPMVPGNWPTNSERCLLGSRLVEVLHGTPDPGWAWVNENAHHSGRHPKFGFISATVGSTICFRVDTTAGVAPAPSPSPATDTPGASTAAVSLEVGLAAASAAGQARMATVAIAHLRSYERMGRASVACTGGCSCPRVADLEGMHERRVSQMHIHTFQATQAADCIISVTVLAGSASPEHKVKIQGIFVSDEVVAAGSEFNMRAVVTNGVLDTLQYAMYFKGDTVDSGI